MLRCDKHAIIKNCSNDFESNLRIILVSFVSKCATYDIKQHNFITSVLCRSSLRVAGRPAYHAYTSSYETAYASYGDWSRSSSTAELQTVGSPVWTTKPVYSGVVTESPLPAPPKPCRSRSPGERSTSSSSQSRDFDADVPVQSWETMGRSYLMESGDRSPARHLSSSPGYPHVFHPGAGGKGPADFAAKTLPGRHMRTEVDEMHTSNLRTRASYRRSEEESAPIAKRLRR